MTSNKRELQGIENPAADIDGYSGHSPNGRSNDVELTVYKKTDNDEIDKLDSVETNGINEHDNLVGRAIEKSRDAVYELLRKHWTLVRHVAVVLLAVGFNAYFVATIVYATQYSTGIDYCNGVGFLMIMTGIVYFFMLYFLVIKKYFGKWLYENCCIPGLIRPSSFLWRIPYIRWAVYLIIIGGIVAFLVIDSAGNRERLVSALGVIVFSLAAVLGSLYPGKIDYRPLFWGLGLQFAFALLTLRWEPGRDALQCIGDKVQTFLNYTNTGSEMVYGFLVTDGVFAFQSLSVMFFFGFFINILYYWGTMQWIIQKVSWILQITMGTTACESINAAAAVFVGMTESPLMIKPYIHLMTKSEVHALMTGGFASIAGSVMASYINMGISASHLLTASIMSAPAALGVAKVFYPETEKSRTTSKDITLTKGTEINVLDAAAAGATSAIELVLGIIANLVAFLAFIAFLDGILSWFCGLLGAGYITFEWLLGKVFIPVSWLLGVPPAECENVGILIGLKTVANEFVAYQRLAVMQDNNMLSPRAEAIATYALCGFSNPGSVGIVIGSLSAICPQRKSEFASIVMRAFVAGIFACFFTACIAGALISESSVIPSSSGS